MFNSFLSFIAGYIGSYQGFPDNSVGKESAFNTGDPSLIPSVGKIPWRREELPTPVFWPGEFHGLYSCKESDTYDVSKLTYGDHTAKMTPNKIYECVHKYVYVLVVEANEYMRKPHHL